MGFNVAYTAHNCHHNTNYGTILMMTTVEQPIPNAKGKDHPREMCMGLGVHMSTYNVFPIPLPHAWNG